MCAPCGLVGPAEVPIVGGVAPGRYTAARTTGFGVLTAWDSACAGSASTGVPGPHQ